MTQPHMTQVEVIGGALDGYVFDHPSGYCRPGSTIHISGHVVCVRTVTEGAFRTKADAVPVEVEK